MKLRSEVIDKIKSRVGRAARIILSGEQYNFYDDEEIDFCLTPLRPILDIRGSRRRLNVITPTLSSASAFGGVSTLIELSLAIYRNCLAARGWGLRYILISPVPRGNDAFLAQCAAAQSVNYSDIEVCEINSINDPTVPIGPGDIFMGSLWHNIYSVIPLINFQESISGGRRLPYISLVQDYEAGFYPFSSAHMLAMASYNREWPRIHIFNSVELANYYKDQGHPVDQSVAFAPVMNRGLANILKNGVNFDKSRSLIFYARPSARRNCFYIGKRALEIWSSKFDRAASWDVVTVGESHRPFVLSNGRESRVLGKLTIDQYAYELKKAAVGLSLMASPHPSYPPLEMAHFGAITVTNSFRCKNLESWHENIVSVSLVEPEEVASALVCACEGFENNGMLGLMGKSLAPKYINGFDGNIINKIGELILNGIEGRPASRSC